MYPKNDAFLTVRIAGGRYKTAGMTGFYCVLVCTPFLLFSSLSVSLSFSFACCSHLSSVWRIQKPQGQQHLSSGGDLEKEEPFVITHLSLEQRRFLFEFDILPPNRDLLIIIAALF